MFQGNINGIDCLMFNSQGHEKTKPLLIESSLVSEAYISEGNKPTGIELKIEFFTSVGIKEIKIYNSEEIYTLMENARINKIEDLKKNEYAITMAKNNQGDYFITSFIAPGKKQEALQIFKDKNEITK